MVTEPTNEVGVQARFLHDHRLLEDLLVQLVLACEENDREAVATLWTLFDAQLTSHMDAEESVLIPLLRSAHPRAARALVEEHKHFRARLLELAAEVDLHVVTLSTVRSFSDELRAHAAHEDRVLYRWADEHLEVPTWRAALRALPEALRGHLLAHTGLLG